MNSNNTISPLKKIIHNWLCPAKAIITNIIIEKESTIYHAAQFLMHDKKTLFRHAKITPTKVGQFITCWQRSTENSTIIPIDIKNNIKFFIISCSNACNQGMFIFTEAILLEQKILSSKHAKGKLAFRVYPPWDTPLSTTANTTQAWQIPFFISFTKDSYEQIEKIKQLIQ